MRSGRAEESPPPLISELPVGLRLPVVYSGTALPLVVAVTEVGIATGRMRTDSGAALVGAAMLSVLAFPLVALALRRRTLSLDGRAREIETRETNRRSKAGA